MSKKINGDFILKIQKHIIDSYIKKTLTESLHLK